MIILQGVKQRPVREAILHCAAVPSGWYYHRTDQQMFDEIKSWHLAKGWRDIGYHYLISPSGHVIAGRPVHQVGAGVIGRNYGFLQIIMIERSKIDRIGKFQDFFNDQQKKAVRRLVNLHEIRIVTGHNDWAAKLCPGFKVRSQDFVGWP